MKINIESTVELIQSENCFQKSSFQFVFFTLHFVLLFTACEVIPCMSDIGTIL